jgi:hypothetical protein
MELTQNSTPTRTDQRALIKNCEVCQRPYRVSRSHAQRRHTCSTPCRSIYQQRFGTTKETLLSLVWNYSTSDLAEEFGVSDKAIDKRCRKFGLPKPPRGYWAKIQVGQSHENALRSLGWTRERIEQLDQALDEAEKENSLSQG